MGHIANILRCCNIACSRLIGRFRRVGSNSLILRGHQRLTHKIGAGDLPLHIGKAQGSAVLDGCRGDIGHIVAVKLSDGFGFRHRVVFRSIAGGYGIETGVIQCEGTLKSAVIIFDGGLELLKDQSKVIFCCFNCDDLGMNLCFFHGIFTFHNVSEGVEISFQLKGLLNQRCRILLRGYCKGFDRLLTAVEVLNHRVRRHLQRKGIGGKNQHQQHAGYYSFHVWESLLLK